MPIGGSELPARPVRVNVGCGQTPTPGWRNFDNSLSLRAARIPLLPTALHRLRLIDAHQYEFMHFARRAGIQSGDATRRLPLADRSADVVYSSHMLEHLDAAGVDRFLREVQRILRPGGVLRLAVPDLLTMARQYVAGCNADEFVARSLLASPPTRTLVQRLRALVTGPRHHLWMYDGASLSRRLVDHGFVDVRVVPPGQTRVPNPEPLDLRERESESVYVEATRPD